MAKKPKGRPAVPSEIKLIRYENANEVTKELSSLVSMPVNGLSDIIKDTSQPGMRVMLARAIVKATVDQDPALIKIILERLIGPVKSNIDINLSGGLNINQFVTDYIEELEEAKRAKE
jgi:hypothetical protein